MTNNRVFSIIRAFLPSILLGFGFLAFILILKPSFPVLLLITFSMSFFIGLYTGKKLDQAFIGGFKNSIILTVIWFVFKWIGSKGVIYATLSIVLVGVIIIIRRWKLYVKTMGDIEEQFFGRRFK